MRQIFLILLLCAAINLPAHAATPEQNVRSPEEVIGIPNGLHLGYRIQSPFDKFSFPYADSNGDLKYEDVQGKLSGGNYIYPINLSARQILYSYKEQLPPKGFEVVLLCDDLESANASAACKGLYTPYHPYEVRRILKERGVPIAYPHEINPAKPEFPSKLNQVMYLVAKKKTEQENIWVLIMINSTGADNDAVNANQAVILMGDRSAAPVQKLEVFTPPALKVAAIEDGMKEHGKIAVYDILFDTDSATLRPESATALAQIFAYLTNNPAAKLIVTGHTDNVGAFDYNVALSQRRAQSVVDMLIHQGITAERLKPFGAGMSSPVAKNDAEYGRSQNRRVELVQW